MFSYLDRLIARRPRTSIRRRPVAVLAPPERLESRALLTAPSLQYHGGPLIPNVDVVDLYYGKGWQATDTTGFTLVPLPSSMQKQRIAQRDQFMKFLVGSSFMTQIGNEYSVSGQKIGFGTTSGSLLVNDANSGRSTITDANITNMLLQQLKNPRFPAPYNPAFNTGKAVDLATTALYVIFTPPNVTVKDSQGNSYNDTNQLQSAAYHGAVYDPTHKEYAYYAVIPFPQPGYFSETQAFQSTTYLASHELAEAVTNPTGVTFNQPNFPGSWYDQNATDPSNTEIADLVEHESQPAVMLGGYQVTKLWSNAQHTGVGAPGSTPIPASGLGLTDSLLPANLPDVIAATPPPPSATPTGSVFSVITLRNNTSQTITYQFNWGGRAAASYTLSPGHYRTHWITGGGQTAFISYQDIVNSPLGGTAAQSLVSTVFQGSGNPPLGSGKSYTFQMTSSTNINLVAR
jgi:hypothetical protein